MEFLVIAILALVVGLVLRYFFDVSIKQIKELAQKPDLDKIVEKYPNNQQVAQEILKKLNNEKVKIEENENAESSLYVAVSDKIFIGNIQKSYTRIQTIAHECLHSVQSRKLLLFHFIFSNFYLLYFVLIALLGILKILPFEMTFLVSFVLIGMLFYAVRIYLENDAMIKAPFLAKEYMQGKGISSLKEIEKVMEGYDELNQIGIKAVNYKLFMGIMIKVFLLSIIFLLF